MPPRTKVLAHGGDSGLAFLKGDYKLDIFRILLPIGTHELPIELRGVSPCHHGSGDRVSHRDQMDFILGVRSVHHEPAHAACTINGIDPVVPQLGGWRLREHPRLPIVHHDAVDGHTRLRALFVAHEGNRPVHAVAVFVESKGARLDHAKAAVSLHRRLDAHVRIGIGVRRHGSGKCACQEQRAQQHYIPNVSHHRSLAFMQTITLPKSLRDLSIFVWELRGMPFARLPMPAWV